MHLTLNNFLYGLKNIVMGGGVRTDGSTPVNDSGFLKDMNMSLGDLLPDVTDSIAGTVSTTLSANTAKQTIHIPLGAMSLLVNGQLFKVAIPYGYTVSSALFRADVAITTGAKAATLTTQINGAALTGGVMAVAGAYATGITQAGTAVSAGNTGTAGQTLEIAVSGVTAFVEGTGHVEVTIVNNDLANALSSINAATGLVASETNLRVFKAVAGTTAVGTVEIVIPRDYDEATDTLNLKILAAMSGATDTPKLTVAAFRKRAGANIATVHAGLQTTTALSSADKAISFNLSRKGLLRDDVITLIITSEAHATDAILVYGVQPSYRSCLVSYAETDGTRDGKDGNALR
jgi:hypothetical protein